MYAFYMHQVVSSAAALAMEFSWERTLEEREHEGCVDGGRSRTGQDEDSAGLRVCSESTKLGSYFGRIWARADKMKDLGPFTSAC